MNTFRFIHTGDIHLDSPLKGLAGQEGAAAERIRTATRAAFSNLIDSAIEEEVAFVIIAGDLYDGDWRDYQTGLFFVKEMGRLAKANIPAFLIYGNHDAENQITKRLTLPDNVRVFPSKKAATIRLDRYGVALHGQSFKLRAVTENLVPEYPTPVKDSFNIGILHTGLGGMHGHANYAPCSLYDLVNKGYDYWALAHVHQGAVLHRDPYVVFCGNLQGRHIREAGVKSATLVSVEDSAVQEVSRIEADVVRWMHVSVDAEGAAHAGWVRRPFRGSRFGSGSPSSAAFGGTAIDASATASDTRGCMAESSSSIDLWLRRTSPSKVAARAVRSPASRTALIVAANATWSRNTRLREQSAR
jgi:DNA repair protein SbcD/Mre11